MYKSPSYNKIPFTFSNAGYSAPNFNDISFRFGIGALASDLNASIIGNDVQRDYLKSQDVYAIGYAQDNIQILKYNNIYGGIRDLIASIEVLVDYGDLGSYIKPIVPSKLDLNANLRGWLRCGCYDLPLTVKGYSLQELLDLSAYLKPTISGLIDLCSYIDIFKYQQADLIGSIKGRSTGNVVDLINFITVNTVGTYVDLPWYIRSTTRQQYDLSVGIFKILQHQQKDLNFVVATIESANINGIIQAFHINDLPIVIRPTHITELTAFLCTIQPVDIRTTIMGWATSNLGILISDKVNYSDLATSVISIDPFDLKISLYGRKETKVIKDLTATLTSSYCSNLSAQLRVVEYKNLNAYLMSSLQFTDLIVEIYPKMINIMHIISVSFLENRDLAATINYPCFFSSFVDLSASCVIKNSKDLGAYIFPWTGDNIQDINCSINSSEYLSQSTIPVQYMNTTKRSSSITLRYSNKAVVYSINTIPVSGVTNRLYSNLSANIYGEPLHKDLNVYIRAYVNRNHLVDNSTNRFIALKLDNNLVQFTKNVELAFNSYASSYYYFSGNKKAYREHRNDHWTIVVEGSESLLVGKGFEKTKVRRKYIFNLRNYNSIDAAIKDIIDRVTLLRSTDLGVQIQSCDDKMLNLPVSIGVRRVYKTNRILNSVIRAWQTNTEENLHFDITPDSLCDSGDLSVSIISDSFTPNTNFNFVGSGNIQSEADDLDFIFEI